MMVMGLFKFLLFFYEPVPVSKGLAVNISNAGKLAHRRRKGVDTEHNRNEDETGKPHSHEGLLHAVEERHSEFAML